MNQKRILTLLFVLILMSALIVPGCAAPTPTQLRFACPIGEASSVAIYQRFWLDEVTKRTNGEITFEEFWGGTLVSAAEALDAPSTRVVDVGFGLGTYASGKVPLQNYSYAIPFNNPDMAIQAKLNREMRERLPALNEELANNNIAPLFTFIPGAPFQLLSREPIKSLEDLKGKRVGHTPTEFIPMFEVAEAVSVPSPAGEFYERLERGVIDAICLPFVTMDVYKLHEVAKHLTVVNLLVGGGYTLWVNMDTWNSLSSKHQQIFKEAGKDAEAYYAEKIQALEAELWEKYEKAGVSFYNLPQEDLTKWVEAMPEIPKLWADKMETEYGKPVGRDIMRLYIELSEREGWKFPREWDLK